MGDSPVSLDLGSIAYYAEDRLRRLFGKDEQTKAWNEQFKKRWENAVEQSRWVQCMGMHRPVPIEQIYQPVAVYRRHRNGSNGPRRRRSVLGTWSCAVRMRF